MSRCSLLCVISSRQCKEKQYVYHSCNHRSCRQCGGREQKDWAAAQETKLLTRLPKLIQSPPQAPSPLRGSLVTACLAATAAARRMLTFTIPSELRTFAHKRRAWFYEAMFKAMQKNCNEFARDPKHLGGTPGYSAGLHTSTREKQRGTELFVT